MKDDYLWDGTGEPDAEIERLEDLLSKFRHQGKAPEMPLTSRRTFWPRLAVAAGLIIMLLAGLWLVLNRQTSVIPDEKRQATTPQVEPGKQDQDNEQAKVPPGNDDQKKQDDNRNKVVPDSKPRPYASASGQKRHNKRAPEEAPNFSSTVALVDFQTAEYIESAQLLLRSFRNVRSEEGEQAPDVSYEKERSRELLYKNILLRRDAEAKGNLPIGELLSSVEPILLDIANLPATPSQADVRSIQERIEKKEIVATLQVYSAPVLGANYRQ